MDELDMENKFNYILYQLKLIKKKNVGSDNY